MKRVGVFVAQPIVAALLGLLAFVGAGLARPSWVVLRRQGFSP